MVVLKNKKCLPQCSQGSINLVCLKVVFRLPDDWCMSIHAWNHGSKYDLSWTLSIKVVIIHACAYCRVHFMATVDNHCSFNIFICICGKDMRTLVAYVINHITLVWNCVAGQWYHKAVWARVCKTSRLVWSINRDCHKSGHIPSWWKHQQSLPTYTYSMMLYGFIIWINGAVVFFNQASLHRNQLCQSHTNLGVYNLPSEIEYQCPGTAKPYSSCRVKRNSICFFRLIYMFFQLFFPLKSFSSLVAPFILCSLCCHIPQCYPLYHQYGE